MPRVVTFITCVSPRWNKPDPWAVGMIPTSEERGRISEGFLPSIRTSSSTIRLRTDSFVIERIAALI